MKTNPRSDDLPPVLDVPLVWRCGCGGRNFVHHTYCGMCGTHRPAPQGKAKK